MSRLLQRIFQDRRKSGRLDLEAIEMAMRSALHQAGAAALSHLLQCDPPPTEERERPCSCGQTAHYRELRSRRILTAVGSMKGVVKRNVSPATGGESFARQPALYPQGGIDALGACLRP